MDGPTGPTRTIAFAVTVDQAGWFDLVCKLRDWVRVRMDVDELPVAPSKYFGPGDIFPFDPGSPFFEPVPVREFPKEVNCIPGLRLNAGTHQIKLTAEEFSTPYFMQDPFDPLLLELQRVPGRLRAEALGESTATPANPSTEIQFVQPAAVGSDALGNVFVAEPQTGRIQKLDSSGNVRTVYETSPGPHVTFRDFGVDDIGNCHFRSSDPTELFRLRTDGVLERIDLPRGTPLTECSPLREPRCDAENLTGNDLRNVIVEPNGTIHYLRHSGQTITRIQPANFFPVTLQEEYWEVVAVTRAGEVSVIASHSLLPGLDWRGKGYLYYGTLVTGLHPSNQSEPQLEFVSFSSSSSSPSTYFNELAGAVLPKSVPGKFAKTATANGLTYLARNGQIFLLLRQHARAVFTGEIVSMTGLQDGSLMAVSVQQPSGKTELVRLRPESSWKTGVPQYTLEVNNPSALTPTSVSWHDDGSKVVLRASKDFVRWSGDVVSTSNPMELVVDRNLKVAAEYGVRLAFGTLFADIRLEPDLPFYPASTAVRVDVFPLTTNVTFAWSDGVQSLSRIGSAGTLAKLAIFQTPRSGARIDLGNTDPERGEVIVEYAGSDESFRPAPLDSSYDSRFNRYVFSFRKLPDLRFYARARAFPGWVFVRWTDGGTDIRREITSTTIPRPVFAPDSAALGTVVVLPPETYGGRHRLRVRGQPNVAYRLQSSTDLREWDDVDDIAYRDNYRPDIPFPAPAGVPRYYRFRTSEKLVPRGEF